MKKLLTVIAPIAIGILLTASLFLPQQASAHAPEKMSYQAVIRNSSNQLMPNTVVGMQISILKGSSTGTLVYTETQTPTTNANGLVNIEIGGGTGFDTISWQNAAYFIKTETDPTGGTNYTITGTSQLLSVPYSLFSKNGLAAYGNIEPDGTINLGSSNYTVSKTVTGTYNISWSAGINTWYKSGIVSISTTTGNPRITSWTSTNSGATLIIKIYDLSGNLVDDNFSFNVFQP